MTNRGLLTLLLSTLFVTSGCLDGLNQQDDKNFWGEDCEETPDLICIAGPAPDFELVDQFNNTVNMSQFEGKVVVITFIYTHCPDVCPVGLAVIRDVLNSNDIFEQVKALFVTLDPERDTPEKLQKYTAFFHSNILGLTGSDQEIREMSASYGTSFRRADTVLEAIDGQEGYTIDHSTYYYLIDSAGELVRVLDYASKPEEIADLLIKLI